MKKLLLFFVVAFVFIGIFSVAALAHGGNGHKILAPPVYSRCGVDDCAAIGPHQHDNDWYCNQSSVNWSDYEKCPVAGCGEIGIHEHDGQWYHCANYPGSGQSGSGCGRNCKR